MISKIKNYQCDLCISQTFDDDKYLYLWTVLNNGKVICPACAETIYARRSKKSLIVDQPRTKTLSNTKGSDHE